MTATRLMLPALACTGDLTRVGREGAPEPVFQALKQHSTDRAIADLTVLAGMIDLWNRIGAGFSVQRRRRIPDRASAAAA